jgi:hypothetical protein
MSELNWTFTPDSSAEQQLLAMTIVLLDLLRQQGRMTLFVPSAVHQRLSQHNYGFLLFDTLSAEHPDLENRLQLRVHSNDHFKVEMTG